MWCGANRPAHSAAESAGLENSSAIIFSNQQYLRQFHTPQFATSAGDLQSPADQENDFGEGIVKCMVAICSQLHLVPRTVS